MKPVTRVSFDAQTADFTQATYSSYQGSFCKKNRCRYALSDIRRGKISPKITSQISKKVDDLFLLFHHIFVYYAPLIRQFLLFNCQFSVASLTNISKQHFSHFRKGAGTQVNYSFKIYIKFFSLQKRCRYAVSARTITKKPCVQAFFLIVFLCPVYCVRLCVH